MQNAPTDVTLMYRYETNSYPNAVYIEPGPFSRFKSLLHDQGFVAIGGLAVILGSATIVAMNKRKISTVSKSVTRFFKNLIYGRPNIGTEHIVPIVPKREETEAPAAIENKPETPKVEEVVEPEEVEAVEAVEEETAEEATPAAVEACAEAPVKVCTEEEKAACTNDCSQCPNNGDIENIKKFSCKEGSVCNCSALPKDAQMKPIAVDLSEGTDKWICRCGQSAKFPYCDGAHKAYNAEHGTSITPLKVNKETSGKDTVYVCACGHAKGRTENPFCDGTHRRVHEVKPEAETETALVEEVVPVEADVAPIEIEVAHVEAEAAPVEAETAPVEDVSSSNFEVSDSTVIVDTPVEEQPVVEAVAEPVVEAEVEPVVEAEVEPAVEAKADVVDPVVEAEVEPVPVSEEVVEAPVEQVEERVAEQVMPVEEVEVSEQPKEEVVNEVVEEPKEEQ